MSAPVELANEIERGYQDRGLTEYPPDRMLAKYVLDQETERNERNVECGVDLARKIIEEKQTCSVEVERMARALLYRDAQVKARSGEPATKEGE